MDNMLKEEPKPEDTEPKSHKTLTFSGFRTINLGAKRTGSTVKGTNAT